MDVTELPRLVAAWHEDRFPGCDPRDVALKLCEEAGETARAVLETRWPTMNGTDRDTTLADELGDVVIAAAALANLAGIDLWKVATDRASTVLARRRGTL